MCDVVKILERELDDTDLAYIYRESDGRWYAYERSAFLLNQLMDEQLKMERFVVENTLWLVRAEVDPRLLPSDSIAGGSDVEYVVRYTPGCRFQDWLEKLAAGDMASKESRTVMA